MIGEKTELLDRRVMEYIEREELYGKRTLRLAKQPIILFL